MSRNREPDLIQFRIEYVLEDDIPVEKFFMALNEKDAIKAFAHSCQKFLSQQRMSEEATDCFLNAFANPGQPFLDEPAMIPVPEEIAEYEPPEEEEPNETQEVQEETVEPPPADPFMQQEDGEETSPFAQSTDSDNFLGAPSREQKEDPAIEHARKKAERDMKIQEANQENERRRTEYEQLSSLVLQQVDELNERVSIIHFEQHNRWADKWDPISYPFTKEETATSDTPREES